LWLNLKKEKAYKQAYVAYKPQLVLIESI
jgi:hypothetical protein